VCHRTIDCYSDGHGWRIQFREMGSYQKIGFRAFFSKVNGTAVTVFTSCWPRKTILSFLVTALQAIMLLGAASIMNARQDFLEIRRTLYGTDAPLMGSRLLDFVMHKESIFELKTNRQLSHVNNFRHTVRLGIL
jgi:hypothetical protein